MDVDAAAKSMLIGIMLTTIAPSVVSENAQG